jgi:hypothetical protein
MCCGTRECAAPPLPAHRQLKKVIFWPMMMAVTAKFFLVIRDGDGINKMLLRTGTAYQTTRVYDDDGDGFCRVHRRR